ncbi:phosphotransferase [Halomonas sp. YLGW01]|uniref:phosphotransferase n=1 Tax=Halomonas sp. YLGW01 TaxID=2773308 RepID=UPI00177FB597|nr:phosphotransferase [Halomonas sp. YLGW01]
MLDTDTAASLPPATPLQAPLAQALEVAGLAGNLLAIKPMPDTGLAHAHLWLERDSGEDWVARLPKQSQMGLAVDDNLAYQAACFTRASRSGHTPALKAVLPPSAALPRGGLLVSAIRGRPSRLPEDLPAIAEALASLHAQPLPPAEKRAPLLAPIDPWAAMLAELHEQAAYLDQAKIAPEVRQALHDDLLALVQWASEAPPPRPTLISFDAHPGNFLVQDGGRAMLVDLEKCRYSLPGFDLAHATLYTSTTWDPRSHAALSLAEVRAFHRAWAASMAERDARFDADDLLQCRRAMWLWSVTWCAKWQVERCRARDAAAAGADWSSELSDPALIRHVADRVHHYLSAPVIARVRDEWRALADDSGLA